MNLFNRFFNGGRSAGSSHGSRDTNSGYSGKHGNKHGGQNKHGDSDYNSHARDNNGYPEPVRNIAAPDIAGYCSQCGAGQIKGNKFCAQCGNALG
ncbi:MAG TPA: zinc ribbon domain-containing protein [Morganella sp. (in: Bacteria)]|nr:zinc ribbon domain-containing protein [Morganella sp. (in: enterobacteria)]